MLGTVKRGTITQVTFHGGQRVTTEDGGVYWLTSIYDAVRGGKEGDAVTVTYEQIRVGCCLWVGRKVEP